MGMRGGSVVPCKVAGAPAGTCSVSEMRSVAGERARNFARFAKHGCHSGGLWSELPIRVLLPDGLTRGAQDDELELAFR